jgi:hypothetical protein
MNYTNKNHIDIISFALFLKLKIVQKKLYQFCTIFNFKNSAIEIISVLHYF